MSVNNPFLFPVGKHAVHNLIQVAAFIFGALTLAIPSGYSYGPAILLIMSLFVSWRPNYWASMSREVKILGAIFIFYFFVQGVSIWLDGGRLRELDRPSRALMAAALLPLLSRYPAKLITLMAGFSIGACIAGAIAIYDKFYLGMERAFADAMPIQAGNISMTMGLLCLCAYFWYKSKSNNKLATFMLFACAMGMLGSFLSGTRGGWVLLPLIIISIVLHFKNSLCRLDKIAAAVFALGLIGLVAIPQTGVAGRINLAKSDVVQFVDGGNKNTSLGIRFQLWYSAWDAFKQKPVFGWGNNGIRQAKAQQLEQGKISKFIYNFNFHAHNQFLDEMAKRGLIGLFALLCLYLYPVVVYKKTKSIATPVSIMLCVSALTLIDYSISQAFIGHNSGITFSSITIVLLATVLRNFGGTKNNNIS